MFPNPLPPRLSTRRKRRLEATEDAERVSKRVAGSSSVRLRQITLYAPRLSDTDENIYLGCSV